MTLSPVLVRLRQEDYYEFPASLNYRDVPCVNKHINKRHQKRGENVMRVVDGKSNDARKPIGSY